MSDKSQNSQFPTIERVFDLLDRWRHLPTYQLERRADIFFALFLPEVLKADLLIPEFPIKSSESTDNDNNLSKKVDYFALSQDGEHAFLIELKTDMRSIDKDQIEFLKYTARNRKVKDLVEDIIEILKPLKEKRRNQKRATRQKYIHLLSRLIELELVCYDEEELYKKAFSNNSRGVYQILENVKPASWVNNKKCPKLEVVYILPKRPDMGIKDLMCDSVRRIYFEDFANAIDMGEEEGIGRLFAKRLREWAAVDAGTPNPKDWSSC